MGEREMLERAAKAAGYDVVFNGDYCPKWKPSAKTGRIFWNPLTDDGDALRLAVKLNLFTGPDFYHFRSLERFAHQDKDEYFVTRLAITRAAASLAPTTPAIPTTQGEQHG